MWKKSTVIPGSASPQAEPRGANSREIPALEWARKRMPSAPRSLSPPDELQATLGTNISVVPKREKEGGANCSADPREFGSSSRQRNQSTETDAWNLSVFPNVGFLSGLPCSVDFV